MERASASAQSNGDGQFRDGLGERRLVRDASGAIRELLCIRAELADVPSFEFALRERVGRLSAFRHPYFAPIRTVERLAETAYPLGIVSERFNGIRLPLLYARLKSRALRLDIDAVVFLLRQLLPAIVKFHDTHRDVSHGAIAPERILFTANGRLMVTEYGLGAALEQLRFTRPRYWRDLRAAIPHDGMVRFDQRTDVAQVGALALSLILGRPLRDDEYPDRVGDAVAAAWAAVPAGGLEPVPPPLRDWLVRALQIDARRPLTTSAEAAAAFERAVASTDYPGEAASIDAFLAAYRAGEPVGSPSGGFGDATAPSLVPASLTAVVPEAEAISPSPVVSTPLTTSTGVTAPAETASSFVPPLPIAPPNMAVSPESAEFLDAFMSEAELEARLQPTKPEKPNRGRRGKGKRAQTPSPVSVSPAASTAPPPAPSLAAPPAAAPSPAAPQPARPVPPAVPPVLADVPTPPSIVAAVHDSVPSAPPASATPTESEVPVARTGVIRPAIANRPSRSADVPPPASPSAPATDALPSLFPPLPDIAWPPPADGRMGALAPPPAPPLVPSTPRATEFVVVPAHADFDVEAALPPTDPLGDAAGRAAPNVAPTQPGLQTLPREWQVIVLIIAFVCAAAALVIGQRFLTPVAPMATGTLVVTTNPRGATASIDGQPIGTTPLSVTVPAGEHELLLQGYGEPRHVRLNMAPGGSIEQYFELPVPPEQAAPLTGWLTLRTPIEVDVLEGDTVIGSSAGGRLSLPTGIHTLLVRNDALGFSATRLVNISAGKSTTLTVDAPKGTIVVHAVPYADVWLDGRKVGQTPIENLPVTIGTHDLVLRHPDLGDHRQTLLVTLTTVSRISVDLRKP